MIRTSGSLSASDLSVRCRVRRSPCTTNPQFEDAVEMTCTMRYWHSKGESSTAGPQTSANALETIADLSLLPRNGEAELVLRRVEVVSPVNRRDNFPIPRQGSLRRKSPTAKQPTHPTTHVPLSDIHVVETLPNNQKKHKMNITTTNHGLYEFDDLSLNSRDVLMAFLQANIPPGRLTVIDPTADDRSVPSVASTESSVSQMDVDKLTEQEMRRCAQHEETISEQFSRKTSRLLMILSDFAGIICDSSCCRAANGKCSPMPPQEFPRSREPSAAKSIQLKGGDLEEEDSIVSDRKRRKPKLQRGMPSGLSLELDSSSVGTSQRKSKREVRKYDTSLGSCLTEETEERVNEEAQA